MCDLSTYIFFEDPGIIYILQAKSLKDPMHDNVLAHVSESSVQM